jgi:periplasmic protein TonB
MESAFSNVHLKLIVMKKYLIRTAETLRLLGKEIFADGLNSETLSGIFANRNRQYGAYALRVAYPTHLRNALLYSFSGLALLVFLLVKPEKEGLAVMPPKKDVIIEMPSKEKIKLEPRLKSPKLATKAPKQAKTEFKPPIVAPIVTKPISMPTMAQLATTTTQIAATTSTGTSDVFVDLPSDLPTGTGTSIEPIAVVAEPAIVEAPEVAAQWIGGEAALLKYLSSMLKYPQLAIENKIEGRVYVQFVVEPDGSVSQVKLVRDIGGGCGREALRVVNQMPNWAPASQNGKVVRSRFTLPVMFKLN